MSYNWSEVFLGVDPGATVTTPEQAGERRRGWFRNLREGLSKSTKALQQQFSAILFDRFDEDLWERIEEALIFADVGVETTVSIVEQLEQAAEAGRVVGRAAAPGGAPPGGRGPLLVRPTPASTWPTPRPWC